MASEKGELGSDLHGEMRRISNGELDELGRLECLHDGVRRDDGNIHVLVTARRSEDTPFGCCWNPCLKPPTPSHSITPHSLVPARRPNNRASELQAPPPPTQP